MSQGIEGETTRQKWRRVVAHELTEYLWNFTFLAFFLLAFTWYRRLLLASYGIHFTAYWAPLIEAAILAKVIMIGDALHLGRRVRSRALAVPAVYRTVVFSLFVILFSLLEHAVEALLRGKPAREGIAELTSMGWQQLLAWYVLIVAALLPFFAMKELQGELGPEKVREMFFGTRAAKP